MKPLFGYFKDFFATKQIVNPDNKLKGIAKADTLLQDLISKTKVPGLSIVVVKEGTTIFKKGYGYANIEEKTNMDPDQTICRVASVSKPIAATALAKMTANEQIDLDRSFYDYVPYFPRKNYNFTIRQLAGHTAGIPAYKGKEYAMNESYTIKEGIRIYKDDALLFKPGTSYLYNSYDWCLISLAMQEVSGMPFENYVEEHVLLPLQMKNTSPEIVDSLEQESNKKYAAFYSKNRLGFRKAIPVNNFYKLAGGGYVSTASDLAKMGQAYLDKQITADSVLAQFLQSVTIDNKPTYYGLGWQVSMDAKGRSYYGHIGNGVGGYSNFFVYPEQQIVFSILINCTDPRVQNELDEIIDLFLTFKESV